MGRYPSTNRNLLAEMVVSACGLRYFSLGLRFHFRIAKSHLRLDLYQRGHISASPIWNSSSGTDPAAH